MFTDNKKGLKKITACLFYALLALQAQAMEPVREGKMTTIKKMTTIDRMEGLKRNENERWKQLTCAEQTGNLEIIKKATKDLKVAISRRVIGELKHHKNEYLKDLTYAESTGNREIIQEAIKNLEESVSKLENSEKDLGNVAINPEKFCLKNEKYNLVGIALFSGKDIVSDSVKYLTNSTTSHVGIILSDQENENQWYCFESTGSESEARNLIYPHVRLTDWDKTVEGYDGNISYRLLVFSGRERVDPSQVTNFVEQYNGKSYTKNPFILLKALFNMNNPSALEIPETVFCSELAALMLMSFNILHEGIPSNCLPRDFTMEKMILTRESRISLEDGIELTPEFIEKIMVKSNHFGF